MYLSLWKYIIKAEKQQIFNKDFFLVSHIYPIFAIEILTKEMHLESSRGYYYHY